MVASRAFKNSVRASPDCSKKKNFKRTLFFLGDEKKKNEQKIKRENKQTEVGGTTNFDEKERKQKKNAFFQPSVETKKGSFFLRPSRKQKNVLFTKNRKFNQLFFCRKEKQPCKKF